MDSGLAMLFMSAVHKLIQHILLIFVTIVSAEGVGFNYLFSQHNVCLVTHPKHPLHHNDTI